MTYKHRYKLFLTQHITAFLRGTRSASGIEPLGQAGDHFDVFCDCTRISNIARKGYSGCAFQLRTGTARGRGGCWPRGLGLLLWIMSSRKVRMWKRGDRMRDKWILDCIFMLGLKYLTQY